MEIEIGGNIIKASIVMDSKGISEGMIGKKFTSPDGGMLFVMPRTGIHEFWMRGCVIPLDMIFIHNNVVTTIHRNCQPCEVDCETYSGRGNMVLEVRGGYCDERGIKELDEVMYYNSNFKRERHRT